MADKKLVATTVSSRETGMQRRINYVTTSSRVEKRNKNNELTEETNRIHISFKRKDSKKLFFTRVEEEDTKKERENATAGIGDIVPKKGGEAEAAKSKGLNTWSAEGKGKGSSSKASHQDRSKEPLEKTTFIVLQKTRG